MLEDFELVCPMQVGAGLEDSVKIILEDKILSFECPIGKRLDESFSSGVDVDISLTS